MSLPSAALPEPLDEEGPEILCCALHGERTVVPPPEIRHAERLKQQCVAVVGHRHRLVEAIAAAQPAERKVHSVGSYWPPEPNAADCAFLVADEDSRLEAVGIELPEIALDPIVPRLELAQGVLEIAGDVLERFGEEGVAVAVGEPAAHSEIARTPSKQSRVVVTGTG